MTGPDDSGPRAASLQAATARVGMIGAGQLARMTHRAAIDLGVHLEVLAERPDDPAVLAGAFHQLGRPDDDQALAALAGTVDVVTLDHELVPNDALQRLSDSGHAVRPAPAAVAMAQDKLHARRQLERLGFPVPSYAPIAEPDDACAFADEHGWPVVLKARRGGYDGRGVVVAPDRAGVESGLSGGGEWLVEAHVAIATELAVLCARRPSGELAVYPVIETVQEDGICRELLMPARVGSAVTDDAKALASRLVEAIGAEGIVAVELFVEGDGTLVVNELALRPHNSGHATIEASTTSQFHNHLRAVLDWPLGETAMRAPAAAMVNVLGGAAPAELSARMPEALAVPGAHVHLYGKQARPGRKLGHVTVLGDDPGEALAAARAAADRLGTT